MHHLKLFPTVIASDIDKELAKKLLPFAKKILNDPDNDSQTWNYKTTFNTDLSNYNLDFFTDFIKNLGNNYLESCGYKRQSLTCDFFISEMFDRDYHGAHEHPNNILSGLIYLQTPEGSSNIRFHDPRFHTKILNLPIHEAKDTNWQCYDIVPEEGLILIWPAWLSHEVLENKSKEGRITAVFNISLGA